MSGPQSAQNYPPDEELLVIVRHAAQVAGILGITPPGDDLLDPVSGLCRLRIGDADVASAFERVRSENQNEFGWDPVLGRNRLIEVPVVGQPQDSIGSGPPVAAPRSLADRPPTDMRGKNVRVGIVDGRVWRHRWLRNSVVTGLANIVVDPAQFDVDDDDRLDRQAGHATFCSGLILQNAPAATVVLDSALNTFGQGSTADVIAASVRLAHAGVHILNLSLGCWVDDGFAPAGFVEMLRQINPELVIVAAAGNLEESDGRYSEPAAFYPAAFDSVVAVAAADYTESEPGSGDFRWTPAPFSNCGPWADLAAPGVDVLSTFVEFDPPHAPEDGRYHEWATWTGTSHSTAIASGMIAATMTEHGLTARQAVAHLRENATRTVTFRNCTLPLVGENTRRLAPPVAAQLS